MVYEAIDQMAQKSVGALLVMEGERLVGIVSERDYARKVILKGKASQETAVVDDKVMGLISIGDVVRGIIDDKEFYIQQLTNYITHG
jgi:CBS domain-containing protein